MFAQGYDSIVVFILDLLQILCYENHITSLMICVLDSSALDHEFEPRTSQTKDVEIGICFFSAKHAAFRIKSKCSFARNQENVSKRSDMCTRGLLFH